MDFSRYGTAFISDIDNKTIANNIIKYVSPYLALEKTLCKTIKQ